MSLTFQMALDQQLVKDKSDLRITLEAVVMDAHLLRNGLLGHLFVLGFELFDGGLDRCNQGVFIGIAEVLLG